MGCVLLRIGDTLRLAGKAPSLGSTSLGSGPLTQDMKDTGRKAAARLRRDRLRGCKAEPFPKGTCDVVVSRTVRRCPLPRERSAIFGHCLDVEVNSVDPLGRKGFRARGTACVHARDSDTVRAHHARFDRWTTLVGGIEHIVLIDVLSAKPFRSPVYDDGAREADLRAQWASILLP